MNKTDLTELARKAGFEVSEITGSIRSPSPLCGTELKRFAKLVAAAEREACAKVAAEPQGWPLPSFNHAPSDRTIGRIEGEKEMSYRIAAAIRARGEK
jgi:hypothetical protein